jgi:hypothetical protein
MSAPDKANFQNVVAFKVAEILWNNRNLLPATDMFWLNKVPGLIEDYVKTMSQHIEMLTHPPSLRPYWLPIDSAPRDGTLVDLWVTGEGGPSVRVACCRWSVWPNVQNPEREGWWSEQGQFWVSLTATHYMPIPAGPA